MIILQTIIFLRQACVLRRCPNRNKREREKESKKSSTSVVSELVPLAVQVGGSPETVNQDGETYKLSVSESSTRDQIEEVEIDEDVGVNIDVNQNEDKKFKNEKKFACPKCGKTFYKKYYAKNHCKAKAPWICPNCSAEIANAQNIKRHTEKCRQSNQKVPENLPQEVECEVCNKGFHNKYNMRRHKLMAHKIMESNTIVCDAKTCPFTTKDAAQLKRHKTLNHSKKAIFECSQCRHKLLSLSGLHIVQLWSCA